MAESDQILDSRNAQATGYIILRQDAPGGPWTDDGAVVGRSADAALRRHLNSKGNLDGTYVAVPERSWKPITVEVKTTTTLDLKPAT